MNKNTDCVAWLGTILLLALPFGIAYYIGKKFGPGVGILAGFTGAIISFGIASALKPSNKD